MKQKKLTAGILLWFLFLMLLQMGITVQAETENTGDFTVTGGTYGTDYTYTDGSLLILTNTKLTITTNGKETADKIFSNNSNLNLVFNNLSMKSTDNVNHIELQGSVELTIIGTNVIDVVGVGLTTGNLTITSESTGSLYIEGTDTQALWVSGFGVGGSNNAFVQVNGGSLFYNNTVAPCDKINTSGNGIIKQITSAPSLSTNDIVRTKNSLIVTGAFNTSTYGNLEYQWDDGNWSSNAALYNLLPESQHTVAIRYAGNDAYIATDASTKISVYTKKDGSTLINEPTNLRGKYEQKLSDVTLSNGWSWRNTNTALTVALQSYPAFFDTASYEANDYDFTGITGYDSVNKRVNRNLTIAVEKADSTVTITSEQMGKTYDKNAVENPGVKKTGSTKDVSFAWYQKTEDDEWEKLDAAPVNVGSYKVSASVEEDANYKEASAEKEFIILQATNSWDKELSIEGWTYGGKANIPEASANFGDVTFTYSNQENGEYTNAVPTNAGTWYVKAIVLETENYMGLESDPVEFKIVEEKAVVEEPEDDLPETDKKENGSVNTGDNMNMLLWTGLMMIAGAGLKVSRKKRND